MANYEISGLPAQQGTVMNDLLQNLLIAQQAADRLRQRRETDVLRAAVRRALRARQAGQPIEADDISAILNISGRDINEYIPELPQASEQEVQMALSTISKGQGTKQQLNISGLESDRIKEILRDAAISGVSSESFSKAFSGKGVDRQYERLRKLGKLVDSDLDILTGAVGGGFIRNARRWLSSPTIRKRVANTISDNFTVSELKDMIKSEIFSDYTEILEDVLDRKIKRRHI